MCACACAYAYVNGVCAEMGAAIGWEGDWVGVTFVVSFGTQLRVTEGDGLDKFGELDGLDGLDGCV